ncbi:MAG: helix-turn-helix domain-containing protein [Pseudomonadota bacterium]
MTLPQTTTTVPALMTQDQAAEYLNVSVKWLERDRWAGPALPFIKVGRHVRYRASDVVAYIEGATVS